jgi:alginate O-acetyltransferase complex protein AlgI
MLVSGLWHGAAWKFIIWSAIHAAAMSIERITKLPERLGKGWLGRMIGSIVTLVVVWVAWVFFRADDVQQGFTIVSKMFQGTFDLSAIPEAPLLFIGILGFRELWFYLHLYQWSAFQGKWRRWTDVVILAIMLACCILFRGSGNEFIYFQF